MKSAMAIARLFVFCFALAFASSQQVSHGAESIPVAVDAKDFASLQDAINALEGRGGVLHIPPGLYEISEPLKLSLIHISEPTRPY